MLNDAGEERFSAIPVQGFTRVGFRLQFRTTSSQTKRPLEPGAEYCSNDCGIGEVNSIGFQYCPFCGYYLPDLAKEFPIEF